jgi:hypothetical protein
MKLDQRQSKVLAKVDGNKSLGSGSLLLSLNILSLIFATQEET